MYDASMTFETVETWLNTFTLGEHMRAHVVTVVSAIPYDVLHDLVHDPAFSICEYNPKPGAAQILMASPGAGRASRSVALKSTLIKRPASFAHYVIAHELAHAHLYNAGRHADEDPEHAADALAEQWGFPRPSLQ